MHDQYDEKVPPKGIIRYPPPRFSPRNPNRTGISGQAMERKRHPLITAIDGLWIQSINAMGD